GQDKALDVCYSELASKYLEVAKTFTDENACAYLSSVMHEMQTIVSAGLIYIYAAIQGNSSALSNLLLQGSGLPLNKTFHSNRTLLDYAFESGNVETYKIISGKVQKAKCLEDHETPLYAAIRKRNLDLVNYFLQ